MNDNNEFDRNYDEQLGEGGGGSRSARSGRQRAGAATSNARNGRGFTSIDRRVRTNAVRAARASVGARTQRARVRTG